MKPHIQKSWSYWAEAPLGSAFAGLLVGTIILIVGIIITFKILLAGICLLLASILIGFFIKDDIQVVYRRHRAVRAWVEARNELVFTLEIMRQRLRAELRRDLQKLKGSNMSTASVNRTENKILTDHLSAEIRVDQGGSKGTLYLRDNGEDVAVEDAAHILGEARETLRLLNLWSHWELKTLKNP